MLLVIIVQQTDKFLSDLEKVFGDKGEHHKEIPGDPGHPG